MKREPGRQDRSKVDRSGFSIMEVVLALAIIATCFVALLGMLPAGMSASQDAANSTIVATVFEEVHNRLQNQPLKAGVVAFAVRSPEERGPSPLFFDAQGVFIPLDAEPAELARRLYRADARIVEWDERPVNTSGLRAVIVELSWPVDEKTGKALGKTNPKSSVTYPVTALTGPDWTQIYPPKRPDWQYREKIEF